MSIEYVELTITDAEPIQITISDIPEAGSGGGGSSLTVREVDGTPTGTATELVLPNGSLSFTGSVATLSYVLPTDSRLADSREWTAETISQIEAEAGTETIRRAWTALRVRQSTRVNPDIDPTGNIFTIGTGTNAQRIRLRRRFASAGDFSQLSIDFSGDNCRIQTQQAGNTPNPLVLGTNGVDRVFLSATATQLGIGGAPTTRPLEIFAGTAGFRLQSSSAVSPPVYSEIARTFDFLTWQDSSSPFNTCTDLVANSNQFNNHSLRVFVHTSGVSDPVLHSVFHSSGRLLVGTDVDNGTDRVQINGSACASNFEGRNGTSPTGITLNNTWTSSTNRESGYARWSGNIFRIGTEKGSIGGIAQPLVFDTDGIERMRIDASGNYTFASQSAVRTALGLATTDSPTFGGGTFNGNVAITGNTSTLTVGTMNVFPAGLHRIGNLFVSSNNSNGVALGSPGFNDTLRLGNNVAYAPALGLGGSLFTLPDVLFNRDAANTFHQRNGTNGQIARWAKTWTSATNNEIIELDCLNNLATFDLAVCSGSVGGNNRGFRIGSKYGGATTLTPWMELAANSWTCPTNLTIAADQTTGSATLNLVAGRAGNNSGTQTINMLINSTSVFTANNFNTVIAGLGGQVTVQGALVGNNNITFIPSSSRTLATNGQFSIEMTSNTAGNLVYRGSDGTTRRMALTFV